MLLFQDFYYFCARSMPRSFAASLHLKTMADESPRDDYNRVVDEYVDSSKTCFRRFDQIRVHHDRHNELQRTLYDLLTDGDNIWDKIRETSGHSQRGHIDVLRSSVENMRDNIEQQNQALEAIGKSTARVFDALQKLQDLTKACRMQNKTVRESLDARVVVMEQLVPGLKKGRSERPEKARGRSPSRHLQFLP